MLFCCGQGWGRGEEGGEVRGLMGRRELFNFFFRVFRDFEILGGEGLERL